MIQHVVSISLLFVGAILLYFLFNMLLSLDWNKRNMRLADQINKGKIRSGGLLSAFFNKKGWGKYFSPTVMIHEAGLLGTEWKKGSYFLTFLIGSIIGAIVIVVYFPPFRYLMPLSLIGGVLATNIQLIKYKKAYQRDLDSKLSIYMNSMATLMGTFGNVSDSLKNVIPALEEPIKSDVENILIKLQNGDSTDNAFSELTSKYPINHVRLFHEQLNTIAKEGAEDVGPLYDIAFKMKKREAFKRELKSEYKQQKKYWKVLAFLPLSVPFLFLSISTDNYLKTMTTIPASIVFLLVFLLIGFTLRPIEKLELYDPTNDEKLDL